MANLRYEVIWQYEITIVVIADLLVVSFFDVLSTHQVRREFWEYSITGNHKLAVFRYPKKIIEFSSILMFLIRTPKTGFHWAERQASKSTSNFMLVHLVKGNYELVSCLQRDIPLAYSSGCGLVTLLVVRFQHLFICKDVCRCVDNHGMVSYIWQLMSTGRP